MTPINTGAATVGSIQKVLLVDDDPIQLRLGRLLLIDAGFTVETAEGADEALSKAHTWKPDVVMSDVLMGDLDGFELCRHLRQDPAFATTPIVLVSAHFTASSDRSLATLVGASALVRRTPDFSAEIEALRACSVAPVHTAILGSDFLRERQLRANAGQLRRLVDRVDEAETRYRVLFENAQVAITILDLDGIVLEANDFWRKLGIEPSAMIGRHVRDFAPPEHAKENEASFGKYVAAGAGRETAVPMMRSDGSMLFMEFALTVIEVDQRSLVFAIGHDVTETMRTAQGLREAEERYRSLVEQIPDVIWTAGEHGEVLYITPNVEQVLGYTREEMSGASDTTRRDATHPDDIGRVEDALARFRDNGEPMDIEYRRRRKDGEWIWVRNRTFARHERDGVRTVDGIFTDITKTRQLEESLRHSQRLEAVGQLTGGIAHDFNNMLAAILANAHFLLEELAENDPRRGDAVQIKEAGERAAALTRQLLAFSRRQILEPSRVDLDKAIAGLERMLRRLISEDIVFHVAAGADLGLVRVDVGQLEQVVMNLVVNARDAMPKGGTLTIETANVEVDAEMAPSVDAAPGPYVVLTVRDTGTGMDADTRRHIFEPFFTTKPVGEGTGLGLSTCYGIVKQSGGTIWVYSEPGAGSVFKVFLPRVGNDDTAMATASPQTSPVRGDETILVIEDDVRVRSAVARMLGGSGYHVLVAGDCAEAMAIAEGHGAPIHLVLSDVVMPGTNGFDAVKALRERHGAIPALFMSGYTEHPALSRAGSPGISSAFIQKPFSPAALAKRVREVLAA